MKNYYQEDIDFKIGYFQESAPVPYPKNNDLWMVPARKQDYQWQIFVGKNYMRLFQQQDLHAELKCKLAFIYAWGDPFKKDGDLVGEIELFTYPHKRDVLDIGWRVSDTWFIFLLNDDFLIDLRGQYDLMRHLKKHDC